MAAMFRRYCLRTACWLLVFAPWVASSAWSQDFIPDLVCPNVGVRSPATRTTNAADEEIVPVNLAAIGDAGTRPPASDPLLMAQFTPGVVGTQDLGIRRLAIWGDSHIASGIFVDELRRILISGGTQTTSSFIPPYMSRRGVRIPVRAFCVGSAWSLSPAYISRAEVATGPALAEMGMAGDPETAYLWFDLRSTQRKPDVVGLHMLYRPLKSEAQVAVSLDDGPEDYYFLEAASDADNSFTRELYIGDRNPLSIVKIHVVAGPVVLQGFFMDKVTESSLTVDVFGIPGSTVNGWAVANPQQLSTAFYDRNYDAVVLEFGTNEAVGNFNPTSYAKTLERALINLRQVFPNAACLLIGAPDRGVIVRRKRGSHQASPSVDQLLRYSFIHRQINEIQAVTGASFGCRAWDWQLAMGGPGSAYRWSQMTPPLMSPDLIHLATPGYKISAAALARHLGWLN